MKRAEQLGYTIIELLITVTISMIVLGVGVPNLITIVRSNATVSEVNELASALNLARSEAVGRGVEIMISPRTGTDWSTGWVVGIDSDDDAIFPESGEPVLRSFAAVSALSFTTSPANVVFKATGEVSALASFAMLPSECDNHTNRQRVMSVAMAGYVDLQKQDCP